MSSKDDLLGFNLENSDEDEINKFIVDLEKSFDDIESDFFKNYETVDLGFMVVNPDTKEPFYNYPTDSGFDLYSMEDFTLESLERRKVPTGLSFDIPEGHEIQVRPKSGLAEKKGLIVLNTPGTVDSGWIGEVKVILINLSRDTIEIKKGMKIAQAVLCPVINGSKVRLKKLDKIREKDRNHNGFGSTGE